MVSFTSFTGITACILLLPSCILAAPVNTKPTLARRSTTTGKFLHISDIHIDPNYKKGADVDDYCHVYSKKRSSDKAGKYGALGSDCDTPPALAEATFEYLKNNVDDIDFIVYTGDTVRHDRDDNMPRTDDEVVEGHKSVLKLFQSAYDVNSVPVIPTIGNNDPYDHNTVEKKDSLFKKLKSIWSPLDLNLDSDFTSGGYFVQEVIRDKLSIVNVNTMYFFEKNDGVEDCSSSSSPASIQIKWLENVLKSYAGKKDHKLYLMGHVPPIDEDGNSLYKDTCYSQYFDLIGKYGDTIVGHFSGHTNKDTLSAVYKKGSKKYTFMNPDDDDASDSKKKLQKTVFGLFNGPSILPKHNPGFRVYSYETGEGSDYPVGTILDWKQYYVDLEKANDDNKVDYQLEYTASDLYNVDHFDGPGVGAAVYNVAKNDNSLDNYKDFRKVDP